uniref:Small ribosomal subunit protein uS9 n=1 Tax=candidate division WWE3 bacterium TaxID=2053526 RepID=A0A7C4XT67_UNCKA
MARPKKVVEEAKEVKAPKPTKAKKEHIIGTGRRKTAVASIFLSDGKGEFIINGVNIESYFPSVKEQVIWTMPFHLIGVSHPTSKYGASIKVSGSGKSGQLLAVVHAISRALAKLSEENHVTLRKAGLLTRDPRMVERKKPYLRKARKQPQYSKR